MIVTRYFASHLRDILKNGRLKVSRLSQFNDPFEFRYRYRTQPPAEHLATANARVHVTAMLETKRAFERLDEIASVPGIDALTIGPTDLAQDLGVPGTPSQHQALNEHRCGLVEIARKHGKAVAMLTDSVESVRQMIAIDATIINYSSDAAVLRASYSAVADEIRRGPVTRA
jgi:2-keto-3-deoxy-L-rhamnonate aldolase RhmA